MPCYATAKRRHTRARMPLFSSPPMRLDRPGGLRRVPPLSPCLPIAVQACGNALGPKDWRPPSPAKSRRTPPRSPSSTVRQRPVAALWAARSPRQAMRGGRCGGWPIQRAPGRWWRPRPLQRSGGRANTGVAAACAPRRGQPPGAEWRVCSAEGAGAGTLPSARPSTAAPGLSGRATSPAHHRAPDASPRGPREAGAGG
jgi:hypothetical protein